jgi:hypothetical protein
MPVSREYLEYIIDQLNAFGPVNARRMFGGAGIYYDGASSASSLTTCSTSGWMTGTAPTMKRQGPDRSGPLVPIR